METLNAATVSSGEVFTTNLSLLSKNATSMRLFEYFTLLEG